MYKSLSSRKIAHFIDESSSGLSGFHLRRHVLRSWTGTEKELLEGCLSNRSIIFNLFLTRCSITRIRGSCETRRPGRKRVSGQDRSRVASTSEELVYAYCWQAKTPCEGCFEYTQHVPSRDRFNQGITPSPVRLLIRAFRGPVSNRKKKKKYMKIRKHDFPYFSVMSGKQLCSRNRNGRKR